MKIFIDYSKMKKLSDRVSKNAYKKAIRAGARLLINDMRSHINSQSGALKASIGSKVDSAQGSVVAYGLVGPRSSYIKAVKGLVKKPARYASPLEFGKNSHPFLLPAWNRNRTQYLLTVQNVVAAEFENYLRS